MKTDLSPDTDVSLLPRADLPVIWDAFKAKADAVRATAETLTVTCITQKEEMALARTTRLTLREIRIAVENKRVELGESHLKEIKKVNSAANAIKEFIQPLEARLLHQEDFAARFEADRIVELSKSRNDEVRSIRPGILAGDVGKMTEPDYAALIVRLKEEVAEIEAANRARIEAERKLAEAQAEAQRVAEVTRATLELAQRVALEEKQRRDAEARAEQERQQAIAKLKADAYQAELLAEWGRQQQRDAEHQARLDAERAVRDADLAEQKRIRDEQYAKLEAELAAREEQIASAALDAARVAAVEEKRIRDLACAPDVEKLRAFSVLLRGIQSPELTTPEALAVKEKAKGKFLEVISIIDTFCQE